MNGFGTDAQVSLPLDPPRPGRALARLIVDLPRIGPLELHATERGLSILHFIRSSVSAGVGEIENLATDESRAEISVRARSTARDHLKRAETALADYVQGHAWKVEPHFDLTGTTAFRTRVYHRLCQIPFGGVISYGELSKDLGMGVGAARAVGQAVGANPVGIFIPCHRVIRSDGTLGGFSGGLDRKVQLLELEGRTVSLAHPESPVGTEILDLFSSKRPV